MARLAISYLAMSHDLEEQWVLSSVWEDDPHAELTGLKGGRFSRNHTAGLLKCSQCGTDVKIHVSPKRNPHSGKLGRVVSLKDHDLCRRCWRQIIRNAREALVSPEDQFSDLQVRREVA